MLSLSHIATSFSKRYSSDDSVTIGDITVDKPPRGNAPNLIPNLPSGLSEHHDVNASLPTCHLSHLRWMMQKDLILGQDFLLLGTPDLARDRYVVRLYRFIVSHLNIRMATSFVHYADVKFALHSAAKISGGI